ncbi:MAG: PIN domain nuclease [Chloroflexota bacterium]
MARAQLTNDVPARGRGGTPAMHLIPDDSRWDSVQLARVEMALRLVGGALAAYGTWELGRSLVTSSFAFLLSFPYLVYLGIVIGASFAFIVGFAVTPSITTRPFVWLFHRATEMPAGDVIAASCGMVIGLLIGALASVPLSFLPWYLGNFLPVVTSIAFAYLGMTAVLSNRHEFVGLFRWPRDRGSGAQAAGTSSRLLLDTSSIIDGRVAEICQTGFLSGPLLVPRFVLHELQHVADSADAVRRGRGRRGLELLSRLQRESIVPVDIYDTDDDASGEVDSMLVALARQLRCPIVTNDYNLNRVAGLQGVRVLNINELANAVKSKVLPGEELILKIIQEGKEPGQGVGYLDDGTMVVVENGRKSLGGTVPVTVSRVLQTVAGRMVFAQPKLPPAQDA